MHYLVRLIVEGDNAKEALDNARSYAGDLCGENDGNYQEFDWYDMNGRWGDSKATKMSTKKAQKMVKEAMDSNRSEFDSAMAHIRYMVDNYTDDQIYEEQFGSREDQAEIRKENDDVYYLSRYQFSIASGSYTNSCYLYSESWGGRVTNQKDLDYILKDGPDGLWVVEVDFHN